MPSTQTNSSRLVAKWLVSILAVAGFLMIMIIATPLVIWLMPRITGSLEPPTGDTLIVLGAGVEGDLPDLESYWRCVYAVRVFRSGSFQRILLSGGSRNGG